MPQKNKEMASTFFFCVDLLSSVFLSFIEILKEKHYLENNIWTENLYK
jgi:hypothetical protein